MSETHYVVQRSIITQWFDVRGAAVSPMTGALLPSSALTPNLAVQEMLALRTMLAEVT